ncbi:MAG: AmmeMemoRadiSam system protein A [Sulfurovaceae bacterium]|nr:AmmeMemoRadiSam system protein A [Sulfurovaceae bacterium]
MNDILTSLARNAIMAALGHSVNFDLEEILKKYPELSKNGASFVTLNTTPSMQLRGCIGSIQAYRPLYEDIILNAKSAALHDPRFMPLTLDELNNIKIEVSILTEPKEVTYKDIEDLKSKITPFKDGVVMRYGSHGATYLPQVWEQLPDFDIFFSSLCLKANLDQNCLARHPEILTYQVKKYEEE